MTDTLNRVEAKTKQLQQTIQLKGYVRQARTAWRIGHRAGVLSAMKKSFAYQSALAKSAGNKAEADRMGNAAKLVDEIANELDYDRSHDGGYVDKDFQTNRREMLEVINGLWQELTELEVGAEPEFLARVEQRKQQLHQSAEQLGLYLEDGVWHDSQSQKR